MHRTRLQDGMPGFQLSGFYKSSNMFKRVRIRVENGGQGLGAGFPDLREPGGRRRIHQGFQCDVPLPPLF